MNQGKSFARLGIIVMLLTSAVAITGMGFGLWQQILTINGEVQTGQVIAEFSSDTNKSPFTDDDGIVDDLVNDPPHDSGEEDSNGATSTPATQVYDGQGSASSADPSSVGPDPDRWDKDVAICTVDTEQDTQGRSTILNISASNGYPLYWCNTWYHVKNTGSIPLKLQRITLLNAQNSGIDDLDIAPGEFWCYDTDLTTDSFEIATSNDICPEVDGDVLVQSPEDFDLVIHLSENYDVNFGFQIDPAPSAVDHAEGLVAFRVEQGAEQDDTLDFQIEFQWVQWNEYVPVP